MQKQHRTIQSWPQAHVQFTACSGPAMGTAESKPEGIITVVPAGTRPAPASEHTDPLLQQLASLREHIPTIETTIDQLDPESVWKDIEVAKGLRQDTAELNGAILDMLAAYQAWHAENVQATTTNQEYIHRLVDQAESKAARAMPHLNQQTTRLNAITTALTDVAGLPGVLQQLTQQAGQCAEQLAALETAAAQSGQIR
jgi:hypothetical protein